VKNKERRYPDLPNRPDKAFGFNPGNSLNPGNYSGLFRKALRVPWPAAGQALRLRVFACAFDFLFGCGSLGQLFCS
jgi:hypothetical protein